FLNVDGVRGFDPSLTLRVPFLNVDGVGDSAASKASEFSVKTRHTICLCLSLLSVAATGWSIESFETPTRSWQLRDHDGPIRVMRHQRVFDEAHTGSGCELIEFEAGQGTYFHVVHSITPSLIHPELAPQVWVKAERPGARLAVRVVLPHTKDPRTGQPASLLVLGSEYALSGQWQQLQVTDIPTQVSRHLRALRSQTQQPLDDREAYIDLIVVNTFQGTALNRIWLDDLEVMGQVQAQSPALTNAFQSRGTRVSLRGDSLLIDDTPQFLRLARYRGEPLTLIRELGFNAILTDLPANSALLSEAQAAGIWVVAAPSDAPLGPAQDQVIAWTVRAASEADEAQLFQTAARARQLKPAGRPVVGDFNRVGRSTLTQVDILLTGEAVRNSSLTLRRHHDWLSARGIDGDRRTPLWVRVELDPAPTWRRQLDMLSLPSPDLLLPDWNQLRSEVYAAVTAGARGVLLDTRQPLQGGPTDPRSSLVRLMNLELQLLAPWFAGGTFSRVHHADAMLQVTQVTTERSRLLVAQRYAKDQQIVPAAPTPEPLSMIVPPLAGAARGFRLGGARLESLYARRVPGGDHVSVEQANPIELVVLSQDPLVLNHLSRSLDASLEERARRTNSLAFYQLGMSAESHRRLVNAPQYQRQFDEWRKQLQQAAQTQQNGGHAESLRNSQEVMAHVDAAKRQTWEQQLAGIDPQVSPTFLSFHSLPLQRELRAHTSQGRWSVNVLAGANLENMASAERSGWTNQQHQQGGWHTEVAFIGAGAKSGQSCLRLACSNVALKPQAARVSPITIQSPPVEMRTGQVARVGFWVKVPRTLEGRDGLLVYDNLGGRDLATRVYDGPEWTKFEFYRVAWAPGPLIVTWELTDAGEVWLDEVSVQLHEPPAPSPSSAPLPIQPSLTQRPASQRPIALSPRATSGGVASQGWATNSSR
ncbi:MAG: hypothetical protein KDB14_02995, partial [Planctomycetales bacterium]|nr:hypothetical protein [Planctomycetales bacterium]